MTTAPHAPRAHERTTTARRSPAGPAADARPLRLAVFVSPHGFGHAARTAAVLDALDAQLRAAGRSLEATLFTSVPRWFFAESLDFEFDYRELACDVGLVQKSAIEEDLPATIERLEAFWSEDEEEEKDKDKEEEKEEEKKKSLHRRKKPRRVGVAGAWGGVVEQVRESGAEAVLCDISPLGLAVARAVGLPSILVENFTWDWIYEPLVEREPRFAPWVERMRALFALADLRIRATPVCGDPRDTRAAQPGFGVSPSMKASFAAVRDGRGKPPTKDRTQTDLGSSSMKAFLAGVRNGRGADRMELVVPPIARRARSTPAEVRARLSLAPVEAGRPMILVSMGGIAWAHQNLERWRAAEGYDFVVPGGASEERREGNLVLLPHHSPVHHPDLVAAADAVVGKLGYSTVAEAYAAGTRFLFPPRPGFREHDVLARFVATELPSEETTLEALVSGAWIARLADLLERPRPVKQGARGAPRAAEAITHFLAGK